MKKTTSTYTFDKSYITQEGNNASITIELSIDHETSTYSIKPKSGDRFDFRRSGVDSHKKWMCVLSCVQEAIEFAVEELNLVDTPKSINGCRYAIKSNYLCNVGQPMLHENCKSCHIRPGKRLIDKVSESNSWKLARHGINLQILIDELMVNDVINISNILGLTGSEVKEALYGKK